MVADEESTKYLYHYLFRRPDGAHVLFLWDKVCNSIVTIRLKTPGSSAEHYFLGGEVAPYPLVGSTTLKDIHLTAGHVEIFRINP